MTEVANSNDPVIKTDDNAVNVGNLDDSNTGPVIPSSLEQRTLDPTTFLYSELTKLHLGEKATTVVEILISKGRLSVNEIHNHIKFLKRLEIKKILINLIQLRCVSYFTEKNTTYYYFNEDGILIMLYSGLIIDEIEKKFKSVLINDVVQNILSLGLLSVDDYIKSNNNSNISDDEIKMAFTSLAENLMIVPVSKMHHSPYNEVWNEIYEKHYKLIPRNSQLSDLKKRKEAKEKAKTEFLKYFSDISDSSKFIKIDPATSLRLVSAELPFTINLDRFLKSRRTKQLVKFSKARVGSIPSYIYSIALKVTEQKSVSLINPLTKTGLLQDLDESVAMQEENVYQEENTPGITITASDVARHLPASLNLRGTLVTQLNNKRSNNTGNEQTKRMKTEDGFLIPPLPKNILADMQNGENDGESANNEEEDIMLDFDDSEPHSISLINSYLQILSTSKIPFLRESKPGFYHIPYSDLMPMLRSSIYECLITATLGPSSLRVYRCINQNRLVSEKTINSTALMKEKDIRSTLALLIRHNAVEIQEVPRTADRAASRAVFLFRSKQTHAYNSMKQNIEWNIANLFFKNDRLKNENYTLLKKANRADVKGKENELLLPSEINQLKMVNERELNVLGRVSKLVSLWEVFKFY